MYINSTETGHELLAIISTCFIDNIFPEGPVINVNSNTCNVNTKTCKVNYPYRVLTVCAGKRASQGLMISLRVFLLDTTFRDLTFRRNKKLRQEAEETLCLGYDTM